MEQRPLSLPEFIGPLSLCANTMDDQYDEFKVRPHLVITLLEIHGWHFGRWQTSSRNRSRSSRRRRRRGP